MKTLQLSRMKNCTSIKAIYKSICRHQPADKVESCRFLGHSSRLEVQILIQLKTSRPQDISIINGGGRNALKYFCIPIFKFLHGCLPSKEDVVPQRVGNLPLEC